MGQGPPRAQGPWPTEGLRVWTPWAPLSRPRFPRVKDLKKPRSGRASGLRDQGPPRAFRPLGARAKGSGPRAGQGPFGAKGLPTADGSYPGPPPDKRAGRGGPPNQAPHQGLSGSPQPRTKTPTKGQESFWQEVLRDLEGPGSGLEEGPPRGPYINEKCFFSTGFYTRSARKAQEAPRGAKSHQKASKASKGPLNEGGPQDVSVPTMTNAIFEY